jgi:hypothetical protein
MLNQHSRIAIPLESLFMIDYLRSDGRVKSSVFSKLILQEYELKEWGIPFTSQDFEGCLSAKDVIDRAHERYTRHFGKSIWGQKTPRFIRYGDLLKHYYPEAKFVHVIRDPRAVTSSLIRSNVHYSNAYYAARRWLRDVNSGLALQRKYPEDVFNLRYEDLVSAPADWLRQICAFLQVDFEPALLTFHQRGTAEYGKYYERIHAKLNEPPDPSRVEAWRKHLTPRQVALVESICGDTMRAFGYEPEYGDYPVSDSYVLYLRIQRLKGLGLQIYHNLTTRRGYLTSFLRRRARLSLLLDTLRNVNY